MFGALLLGLQAVAWMTPPGWGANLGLSRFCYPDGPTPCDVMIIGEGPGKHEAANGACFVGPAGDTLDTFLWKLGLERGSSVYTTNLVKYRVAEGVKDEPPTAADVERDWPLLQWEIETVQPRFIISLGGAATRVLTTPPHPMDALNGRPIVADEYSRRTLGCAHLPEYIIPTIHPAAGLRDPDLGGKCYQGLRDAIKFIKTGQHPFMFDYPTRVEPSQGIYKRAEVRDLLRIFRDKRYQFCAIDTEGSRKKPWMLSFSVEPGVGWIIYAEDRFALTLFNHFIEHHVDMCILHSALFDLGVLRKMGVIVSRYHDTMVLTYLGNYDPQGLKGLSWRACGIIMSHYEDVVGPYSLVHAIRYLEEVQAWLTAGNLHITVPSTRAHTPLRRLRDALARLRRGQEAEAEDAGGDDADEESKSPDKKLRAWWRGSISLSGKTKGFPPSWSQLISEIFKYMPHVERDDVPPAELLPYSGRDADATLQVFPYVWKRHEDMGLQEVYATDMRVIPMLDRMQEIGMPLDLPAVWALEKDLKAANAETGQVLTAMCGPDFNPRSGDDVADFLFGKLGVPITKLTKSRKRGATDDKVMEAIVVELLKTCGGDPKKLTGVDADIHRFVTAEQDFREQDKMLGTFVGPLWGFYDRETGRVHPNWRSTRVVSGRLAAFDPNLLAFPARSAWGKRVRKCFRAGLSAAGLSQRGRRIKTVLKSFDLDQIEMRVMASEAGDSALIEAFLTGQDVHWANAALIFRRPYEEICRWDTVKKEWKEVTKGDKDKLRDPCKNIGFGVLYGITYIGLQAQLFLKGLDYTAYECQALIDGWYAAHPEARRYLRAAADETRRHGFVRDRWGRIRHLPGVWSDLDWIRAEAERQAGNFKIQACAQGVIKRAMIKIWEEVLPLLWAMGYYVQPLLQVHDELIFEMEEEAEGIATSLILEAMQADSEMFVVPVTSKGVAGESWGELKG